VVEKVAALVVDGAPVLAFFLKQDDVVEISKLPGWAAITGATPRRRREEVIEGFNQGRFDGLAVTYGVASCGYRFPGAKTLAFAEINNDPTVMAQAAHRAPQAKTVLV